MEMKVSKKLFVMLLLLLPLWIFSCNQGEHMGFNAPTGSAVTLPEDGSWKSAVTVCVITDINVKGPCSACEPPEIPTTKLMVQTMDLYPLSNIQIQLGCSSCTVLDKTDGSDYILHDTPLELKTTPYMAKTNNWGFYQVEVCVSSPLEVGGDSVEGQFWADIGVANAQVTYTVEKPDEE